MIWHLSQVHGLLPRRLKKCRLISSYNIYVPQGRFSMRYKNVLLIPLFVFNARKTSSFQKTTVIIILQSFLALLIMPENFGDHILEFYGKKNVSHQEKHYILRRATMHPDTKNPFFAQKLRRGNASHHHVRAPCQVWINWTCNYSLIPTHSFCFWYISRHGLEKFPLMDTLSKDIYLPGKSNWDGLKRLRQMFPGITRNSYKWISRLYSSSP